MTTPDPAWPDIYKFSVDDPVQGGPDGIDNLPIKQLEMRTDTLLAGQAAQAGEITQLQTNLTNLTQVVAGSQAEVLAGVVRAQMSGAGVYSEQFAADWTLIDTGVGTAPLALTDAVVPVAGDDSLDVTSTAKLLTGETYVLFNHSGYRQEVTVQQILGPNRLRVTPALTGAVAFPAWLGRTDWDVSTVRQATAPAGGIYRTRPLDFGAAGTQPKAIIIRHSGPGSLDVEWQSASGGDFIDAPWWRRRTVDGQTETQYLIPTSGPTRLRITALGVVTVHWIATQPTPAMAEGAYNPHPRPRLISPTQGDQALGPQPVLQIAAYTPPPGLTVAGVVYEVVKVSDNSVVHTSPPQPVNAVYTLPDGVVQQGTDYRFTARIKAGDGSLGDPAKPVIARTIPDFRVILAPTILISGDIDIESPLPLSPFAVQRGSDTLAGKHVQISTTAQWETAIDWIGGPNDLFRPVLANVVIWQTYVLRARYRGQDLGWSGWSTPVTVRIDDTWWFTLPGPGQFIAPAAGRYLVRAIGGGQSGGSSIPPAGGGYGEAGPGGGAGDFAEGEFVFSKGQSSDFLIGRGGDPVASVQFLDDRPIGGNNQLYWRAMWMRGQSTSFSTLLAAGGGDSSALPYGVSPPSNGTSTANDVWGAGFTGGPGSSVGGGTRDGAAEPSHVRSAGGSDGRHPAYPMSATPNGGRQSPGFLSQRGLSPGAGGQPGAARGSLPKGSWNGTTWGGDIWAGGGGGAGGLNPPNAPVSLAQKGGGDGDYAGGGGDGFGAGGGGAARPAPGQAGAAGGKGANGALIIQYLGAQ